MFSTRYRSIERAARCLALAMFSLSAWADTLIVPASQDSFIDLAQLQNPSGASHNGQAPILRVLRHDLDSNLNQTQNQLAYFHFDLRQRGLAGKRLDKVEFRFQVATAEVDGVSFASGIRDGNTQCSSKNFKSLSFIPYDNALLSGSEWAEDDSNGKTPLTYGAALHPEFSPRRNHIMNYMGYEPAYAFIPAIVRKCAASIDPAHYGAQIDAANGVISIDVTDAVAPLVDAQFSIVMQDHIGWPMGVMSRESSATVKPQLSIGYSEAAPLADRFAAAHPIFDPSATQKSEQDIVVNPLTGLYRWIGANLGNPKFTPEEDFYRRYEWAKLEVLLDAGKSSDSVYTDNPDNYRYDFDVIEADIRSYIGNGDGRKFAFRVRSMLADGNQLPQYLNKSPYIQNCQAGVTTTESSNYRDIPNWSHPYLQERTARFVKALAQRYDGDPRIAWLDIGMYGRWGEWAGGCPLHSRLPAADEATIRAEFDFYLKLFTDNFKQTPLVMKVENPYPTLQAMNYVDPAYPAMPKIGLRQDSIGSNHLTGLRSNFKTIDLWRALQHRWKLAPRTGEFYGPGSSTDLDAEFKIAALEAGALHLLGHGNGNISTTYANLSASQQQAFDAFAKTLGYKLSLQRIGFEGKLSAAATVKVHTRWSNLGMTPSYEPWRAVLKFAHQSSGAVFDVPLPSVRLDALLPTKNRISGKDAPVDYSDVLALPGDMPSGVYRLSIAVEDARRGDYRRRPLRLYNAGEQADRSFSVGNVEISTSTTTSTTTTTTATTTITTTTTTVAPNASAGSFNVVGGWNLLGNSAAGAVDVTTAFGDAGKTTTVWKWLGARAQWAFFTPAMTPQMLNDYAASKGYAPLSTIDSGEGFWVNAKTDFATAAAAGAPLSSSAFVGAAAGWWLIASGDQPTPRRFCAQFSAAASPPTSLWAWDATRANWYFYAAELDVRGGAVLRDYIAAKGYLDFADAVLSPTTGFWIAIPAKPTPSP